MVEERRKNDQIISDLRDRIIKLEAEGWHNDNHWKEVKLFMTEARDCFSDIKTQQAVMISKQNSMESSMTNYQKLCDTERKDINNRVIKVEDFQSGIIKLCTIIGAFSGGLVTFAIKWLEND